MTFNNSTSDADPGSGKIAFNNGTLSSVSILYVDDADDASADISSFVQSWDDVSNAAARGIVTVTKEGTPSTYATFKVSGAVTDASGYTKVPVTHVVSAGSFSNTDGVGVHFSYSGVDGSGNVSTDGTQTLTNKTLTSPKIGTSILDTNGNELFLLTATGSAVNEITYANAASGNNPTFTASGETNVGVSILPKGSGQVTIDNLTFPAADGSANQILKTDGSGNLAFIDQSTGLEWQSSIVTGSTLTAVAGRGYWINTTSNACTVTLPSSGSVGDQLIFVDYARNWGTNAVTLSLNGLKYQAGTANPVYDTAGQTVNIVYSGTTNGWIPISDDDVANEGTLPPYSASYLVIAGGGAGGRVDAGGGGAGGYLTNVGGSAYTFNPGTTYTVTIGAGGAAVTSGSTDGPTGSNSVLSGSDITDVTSLGGGGGGGGGRTGNDGGSGGGAGTYNTGGGGGSGTSGQGNDGGDGQAATPAHGGGGGGGAGAAGGNGSGSAGGAGGNGLASSITGSSVTRGGGGGGMANNNDGAAGSGGSGGGGAGKDESTGGSGSANTGGGGGGVAYANSGAGGSGVVILSVPDASYSGTTSGSPTVATGVSGQTIITFTGSGSYTG